MLVGESTNSVFQENFRTLGTSVQESSMKTRGRGSNLTPTVIIPFEKYKEKTNRFSNHNICFTYCIYEITIIQRINKQFQTPNKNYEKYYNVIRLIDVSHVSYENQWSYNTSCGRHYQLLFLVSNALHLGRVIIREN